MPEPRKDALARNEWLTWRKTGVGGSDAPIIMGMSKHRGRLALFVDKLDRGEDPDEPTEAAMWGRRLEDLVATRFSEVTGLEIREPEYLERHPVHTFMIATPDRYVFSDDGRRLGILEVKTCSLRREWEWDPEPTEAAVCQLRHYMAVCNADVGWLAVLIGGQRFLYHEVRRDPEFEARLIEEEQRFWWHVQNDVPPEPDGRDSTSRIIDARYPESRPLQVVEFTGDARAALEQFLEEYASTRQSKEVLEQLKNTVKLALGEAEVGSIDGRPVVSWRGSKRTSVNLAALRRDAPGLVEQYTRETSLRTFRVHPQWSHEDLDPEEDTLDGEPS